MSAAIDPAALLAAASRRLQRLPPILEALTADLDLEAWHARPRPEEWSPLEIVCHLRDEEVEDFRARLLVVVHGDGEFPPNDPERWVEARRYREDDPAAALAELNARRAESLVWLETLEPARLTAGGRSPGGQPLSGLDLLAAWAAHDLLHLRQLAGALAHGWATTWAPLAAAYAGPIPHTDAES